MNLQALLTNYNHLNQLKIILDIMILINNKMCFSANSEIILVDLISVICAQISSSISAEKKDSFPYNNQIATRITSISSYSKV